MNIYEICGDLPETPGRSKRGLFLRIVAESAQYALSMALQEHEDLEVHRLTKVGQVDMIQPSE